MTILIGTEFGPKFGVHFDPLQKKYIYSENSVNWLYYFDHDYKLRAIITMVMELLVWRFWLWSSINS